MQIQLSPASILTLEEIGVQFPRASRSALNKMAKQVKTFASQEIRDIYNIKKQDVDQRLSVTLASYGSLLARIRSTSQRFKLILFGARQTRRGVSVAVKRGNRRVIRHTFIATMPSGHENVFVRTSRKRLPIRSLTGPGVSELFGSKLMRQKIDAIIQFRFIQILTHEVQFFIERKGAL